MGPQFRTNVTILDNDLYQINAKFTRPISGGNTITTVAGTPYVTVIQARMASMGNIITHGGERFLSYVENYNSNASTTEGPGLGVDILDHGPQRNTERTRCNVSDYGNGTYAIKGKLLDQGVYQQRIWHAFPGTSEYMLMNHN